MRKNPLDLSMCFEIVMEDRLQDSKLHTRVTSNQRVSNCFVGHSSSRSLATKRSAAQEEEMRPSMTSTVPAPTLTAKSALEAARLVDMRMAVDMEAPAAAVGICKETMWTTRRTERT